MIEVRRTNRTEPFEFEVTVKERGSETRHQVSMGGTTYRKLTGGSVSPDRCIEAAFHFLLDREPKESILRTFDVTVISQYFPEFEQKLGRYLRREPS